MAKQSADKRKCKTPHCRKKPAPNRRRCEACRRREWVAKNPIRDKFNKLRSSAKRRGKVFTITLEYFTQWCIENDYHLKSGRTAGALSIDRKKNHLGYEPGNLQALTVQSNTLKYSFVDKRPIPDDFIQETYEELETLFTADDSINNLPGNDIEEIPF